MRYLKSTIFQVTLAVFVSFTLGLYFASPSAFAMKSPLQPWITLLSGDIAVDEDGVVALTSSSIVSANITDGTIVEADVRNYDDDGLNLYRVAKGSIAVAGYGAVGTGSTALGFTLPAKSILKHSYAFAQTRVQTTTGNPTIQIGCSDDVSEIMNAQAASFFGLAVNSMTNLLQTDDVAVTGRYLASACTPYARVLSGSFSQGVLDVFVEYIKAD